MRIEKFRNSKDVSMKKVAIAKGSHMRTNFCVARSFCPEPIPFFVISTGESEANGVEKSCFFNPYGETVRFLDSLRSLEMTKGLCARSK